MMFDSMIGLNHRVLSSKRFIMVKHLEIKSLIRARVNLYPNIGRLVEHDLHEDYKYPHKTAVLYFNTCDGYTGFEDGTC